MLVTGSILAILALLLLASFINHWVRLSTERKLLTPPGTLVDIGGKRMHIYTEGSGEETLVFLSGAGTCSPVLDFKSLYSLLSDDYQIAVVEKFGGLLGC